MKILEIFWAKEIKQSVKKHKSEGNLNINAFKVLNEYVVLSIIVLVATLYFSVTAFYNLQHYFQNNDFNWGVLQQIITVNMEDIALLILLVIILVNVTDGGKSTFYNKMASYSYGQKLEVKVFGIDSRKSILNNVKTLVVVDPKTSQQYQIKIDKSYNSLASLSSGDEIEIYYDPNGKYNTVVNTAFLKDKFSLNKDA